MIRLTRLLERAKIIGKVDLENNAYNDKVSQQDLKALENVLDNLFKTVKIDINFTRHFLDRVNDPRNKEQITIQELRSLFQKTYQKYKEQLVKLGPDTEAVLKDLQTNVNIPFVLKYDSKNKELDLISKTVMRKASFLSKNKFLKV